MKKIIIASLIAFLPLSAGAYVDIVDVKVDPNPAAGGQNVGVEVTVNRQGSACTNNWYGTRITVDGSVLPDFIYPVDAHAIGNGTSTETHTITAPSSNGVYDVVVEVLGGPETNPNNCAIGAEDSAIVQLTVQNPVPAAPASKSANRGISFVYCTAERTTFCRPQGGFGANTSALQIEIIKQLIPLYQKLIELVS